MNTNGLNRRASESHNGSDRAAILLIGVTVICALAALPGVSKSNIIDPDKVENRNASSIKESAIQQAVGFEETANVDTENSAYADTPREQSQIDGNRALAATRQQIHRELADNVNALFYTSLMHPERTYPYNDRLMAGQRSNENRKITQARRDDVK